MQRRLLSPARHPRNRSQHHSLYPRGSATDRREDMQKIQNEFKQQRQVSKCENFSEKGQITKL